MTKTTQKILANVGALITVAFWGTSFISSKVLLESAHLTPIEVYIYRFAIAYLLLLGITFKKIFAYNWKDELTLLLCGVCAGSLYYILENYALQHTTTGNVSLLTSISPLLTTALMALVLRKKVSVGVVVGSVIAFVGVGLVIFGNDSSLEINPLGDLLALSSAMSWAVYSIAVKRLIPIYSSLFITRKLFFYGVITALPLLLFEKGPLHFVELFTTAEYLWNLVFLVLFCTIIGYLIWNYTMKTLGPVKANNYLYMQPLMTMVAAYLAFGERISIMGYIGCAMVIGGLIISDKLKFHTTGIRHIRK